MSTAAKSASERKRAERQRKERAGLVRREAWIHPDDWPAVEKLLFRLKAARTLAKR